MTLDGRSGAYMMTFSRVIAAPATIPAGLLEEVKTALYITDASFDRKLTALCFDAIDIFQQRTSSSVLPQTVTVVYQYFKGKNKVPFGPHNVITPIADYTITGSYIDGGTGEPVTIVFTAGYEALPTDLRRLLIKMVSVLFRDESYTAEIYDEIRHFAQWMD